jgi:DNA-binding NtrC family response regulator
MIVDAILESTTNQHKGSLLILENDPAVLSALSMIRTLRPAWDVEIVNDARAALERLSSRGFDRVILNLDAPGLEDRGVLQSIALRWRRVRQLGMRHALCTYSVSERCKSSSNDQQARGVER